MSESLTSLALTMHSKKGIFALLLGSGISRAAQIPTGWEILLDLIRRLAAASGYSEVEDLEAWYQDKFGESPNYSAILEQLGKTPAERQGIIEGYIEPTLDDLEEGRRIPTDAHVAIASLVADGYIRVIVTTNFDQLLETAIRDVGVVPSVISSPDGLNGTLPLVHNRCTIIKIHGDYKDPRIKNTVTELSGYDPAIVQLLRQVFSEYGLVVSGWSAEWDQALAELVRGVDSRWFSTYWNFFRLPSKSAELIVEARSASVVPNMDANTFFIGLREAVESLEDMSNSDLISARIAEASLKRYISDPRKTIRVHDLAHSETNRIRVSVLSPSSVDYTRELNAESIDERLNYYDSTTEVLRAIYATGCYWGGSDHHVEWVRGLESLATFEPLSSFKQPWRDLRYYPSMLALYSGGIAALAADRYETLKEILYFPTTVEGAYMERLPLIWYAKCQDVSNDLYVIHSGGGRFYGNWLSWRFLKEDKFWTVLNQYIVGTDRRQECFLRFEYFLSLVHLDTTLRERNSGWAPRLNLSDRYIGGRDVINRMNLAAESAAESWPPLLAGMFDGSVERFGLVRDAFAEILDRGY